MLLEMICSFSKVHMAYCLLIIITISEHFFFVLQVAAKKETLKSVTDYITDIVCKRAELGYNYGVILIPEGLIDFIPEV